MSVRFAFMNYRASLLLLISVLLFTACQFEDKTTADQWIENSIAAHGLDQWDGQTIAFSFRDHSYTLWRQGGQYEYTRFKLEGRKASLDRLNSSGDFSRTINDRPVKVVDSMRFKYSESINSVGYFFALPLPLMDKAVIREKGKKISIGDQSYQTIHIRFNQEGGGPDYEDEFRYWFNTETKTLDFLAYKYATDGGGVRFREATKRTEVSGMIFQDYKNFKPESKDTPLDSLPQLWNSGELKLLSEIENEAIQVIPR